MADKINKLAPTGNMDKDSDVRYVGKAQDRQGDTVDNRNTQISGDDGATAGDATPTLGNVLAFDLGEVSAQNKRYRITVDGDSTKSHSVRFLSTKRDFNMTIGTGSNGDIEFDGTITSLSTAFLASTQSGVFSSTVVGNTMEFEVTNGYDYYQWYLESTGSNSVLITCIQEAIPTDLVGPLKDIGSFDVLGDLFVFSTSQDNDPLTTDLHVNGIGPIGSTPPNAGQLVGPLTTLSFTTDHGLQVGQWIRMLSPNNAWLSGLFVIQAVTSSTGISIITDTAWGGVHPTFAFGEESVIIYPNGIGEIGVAQKDNNTDTWSYTRLLRSVELNFVIKSPIDCFADSGSTKKSIYYTDNKNRPRTFYYYGEYEEDGALNDNNDYGYGSINSESSLQLPSSPVVINLEELITTGGAIKAGTKYYLVQQLTEGGDEGPITSLLGPIVVYNEDGDNNGTTYGLEIGGEDNSISPTSKRHRLSIKNLNGDVYSIAKIIYVEIVGGVTSANVIHEFNIAGVSDYEYTHTGFEVGALFDVGEVFAASAKSSSIITKAKNIREIDSRATLSNVSTVADLDLSKWAESIRHELFYDEYPEGTLKVEGEMQDSLTTLDDLGLMLNETYRMGCRVHLTGLGWTDYYWIDDIKIDANTTNLANPLDNRRDSGLPNYELTAGSIEPLSDFENDPSSRVDKIMRDVNHNFNQSAEYVGTNIAGTMVNGGLLGAENGWIKYFNESDNIYTPTAVYRVPKIKFNIDWGFIADDLFDSLSEGVDAIEFGIGNVANSVKASGIGVLSCKMNKQAYNPNGATPVLGLENSYYTDGSIFEFPFHPYKDSSLWSEIFLPNYPFIRGGTAIEVRDVVSFYSPEQIINGNAALSGATKVLSIGSSMTYKALTGDQAGVDGPADYYSLFHPQGDMNTVTEIEIEETAFVSDSLPLIEFNNGDKYTRMDAADAVSTEAQLSAIDEYEYRQRENDLPVFKLAADAPQYAETEIRKQQRGVSYMQVYNDESSNYPRKRDTEYLKIGKTTHFPSIPSSQVVVNGGDTSTSLFYFKQRSRLRYGGFSISPIEHASSTLGIVCQTRINVKALDPYKDDPSKFLYPYSYLFPYTYMSFDWGLLNPLLAETPWDFINNYSERVALRHWGSAPSDPVSATYTPINNTYHSALDYLFVIQTIQPLYPSYQYSTSSIIGNSRPTRITWSQIKIQGSTTDNYRLFLPLSVKDLSPTFGEINHHEDVNGELFTLQSRKYQLQYFNARGTLEASNTSVDVLLGSGDVLSRDGQTLSTYGTAHKWSAIKGFNPNGKDTLYWLNVENGVVMRFGEDGTRVISNRGMKAHFANFSKWVKDKHEHAYKQGIRCVWDDRRDEVIWTFTAWRDNPQWVYSSAPPFTQTLIGTVVRNDNAPSDTYEEFPRFFKCILGHTNSLATEPAVGADWETYWEAIPYTDHTQYSIFTVCFNENTNGFRCFYGHLPKTYLKWQNTFLSSHPNQRNLIFEHRRGTETTWYAAPNYKGGAIAPKTEDASFEMVMNELPEQSVRDVAVMYASDNVPDRVEYRTKNQYTFDEATEFEERDDHFFAPIRNDATATGNPDSDDGMLKGDYLRVKFIIFGGTYNLLHSIVVKFRDAIRRINT